MRTKIHRYIYLAGLIGVCVGMPCSSGLNSISQAVIAINWVAEGNYISKLKKFYSNKAAMVLCSFYIMHLLGLLYTTHTFASQQGYNYALEDINKKFPLFLFPFIMSSSFSLSDREKRTILLFFMLAVTVVTFIGGYRLINHKLVDIHDISPYIAPVRLAMMMVLSVFFLGYWASTHRFSFISLLLIVWSVWFIFFLFVMQSLTAIVLMVIISLILLLISSIKAIRQRRYLYGFVVLLLVLSGVSGTLGYTIYFYHHYFPKVEKVDFSKLDKATPNGHLYRSDPKDSSTENGNYINLYICEEEMKPAWNKRSKIPFDSNDLKGNQLKATLTRYLSSMGLRKDSTGISKLTDQDISAIELGIPNYHFNSLSSMNYRLYQVFWEIEHYRKGGGVNGHSVIMRLEYWRIALILIRQHPLFGVGTGDVRKAFDNYYERTHSELSKEYRLRAHEQYLEITVGFGLVGLAWFIFSLLYPPIRVYKVRKVYKVHKDLFRYIYIVFFIMITLSFLTEDTLETEAGSTFYAFFNSFFLFL